MQEFLDDPHKELKLRIQGLVPPGQQLHRNVLFDQLYASIPKDPEAKVQIYTSELAPKGWTNFHCHNGATFFLALQGVFEAHFEEGDTHSGESRRCLFGADREDAPRPQPARIASLSLRRLLHHVAGSRSRDQRAQGILTPRKREAKSR